ncbi:phylloplanin-like [Benincasa hispida]|uniref:phylloplanin-like n=1 Tax=Benincasa hispida TaxID=102211 RepID=UPI0018FFDBA3|nr:phylloplanin-like [Benincasa hispida]
MGLKSVLFVLVIVGAMGAPLMVEAQLGIVGSLLGLIRIQGTVFCTANGNIGINGTATPIFPNASVQLQCGNGNIVSTTTTNNMGVFSILLNPLQFLLSLITSSCSTVVNTPLSNCNVTLPSTGVLLSRLGFVGQTMEGILNILNVAPNGFEFLPSL